jgi:uncharacterized cupredoxin-like copper-binding protein
MSVTEKEHTEGITPSTPTPEHKPTGSRAGVLLVAAVLVVGAIIGIVVLATGGSSDKSPAPAAKPAAPAPAATPPSKLDVGLAEFTVTPSSPTASAGKVTFAVNNTGKVKHEFVVLSTPKPASDLLKGDEADESGNVGEIGNVPVGSTKTLTLTLKPGHYALICNLTGHYKAGQHADLTVK